MPAYQILLSKTVRKQLNSLPVFIHNKIIEDITLLAETPRPTGCKKLKGQKNAWRIRLVIIG
jgi:mRNA interferase RelE/StbE